MSTLIHPKTIKVDGLAVRYAEGGQDGPDVILMSPWPESVYAFEPAWPHLAAAGPPSRHRSPRLRRIGLPPNADEPKGNGAFHP